MAMASGTSLHRPRGWSLWLLVRRLLCRKKHGHRPTAAGAEEDQDGAKRSLLGSRGSCALEELIILGASDGGGGRDVCRCAARCGGAKEHGQCVQLPRQQLHRPVAAAVDRAPEATAASSEGGSGAAVMQYRRFVFGGFRRRLMMRRSWRPMLVSIPEGSIAQWKSGPD